MHDRTNLVVDQDALHEGPITALPLDEHCSGIQQLLVPGAEIVENHHWTSSGYQGRDHVGADVPRASDDKDRLSRLD
jgi:hypothetical protein